jgi:hypothetical protein
MSRLILASYLDILRQKIQNRSEIFKDGLKRPTLDIHFILKNRELLYREIS